MKSTWKINRGCFAFDFDDLECMDRYEAACKELQRRSEEAPKFGSRQEFIRYYCESFFAFYDAVFGAGTADQIFNGRYNMDLCDQVHDEFLGWVRSSIARNDRERTARLKNRQAGNRKQRSGSGHRKKYYQN